LLNTSPNVKLREPSAAKPQPKRKNGYHHEAHEEHEGRLVICQIHFPYPAFVSFAIFVVKKSFVESRISDNRPPEKFAQAAKT